MPSDPPLPPGPPDLPYELSSGPAPEPPPAARVHELTSGEWIAQALSAAAELGVADQLASGPLAVEKIAEAVGADAPSLHRLLRPLADVGVFEELDGGRRYALTPVGRLMRGGTPDSMRDWARLIGLPAHRAAWTGLAEAVRTGVPAFEQVHGQPGFDYFRDHPGEGDVLDGAMNAVSAQFSALVAETYDFSGFGTVVDVGGGRGALIAAVLARNPGVRGILFDLPHVIAGAGGPLREAGVEDRCRLVGGDFFASVPPGGDAYVLSNIIHDWDDERAVRILAACRAALAQGGRVLLVEGVLPGTAEPSPVKWIDLEMLVMGTGRQRTAGEFRRLFEQAGLRLSRIVRTGGTFDVVEAVPAPG